jgi:hypothetical protein
VKPKPVSVQAVSDDSDLDAKKSDADESKPISTKPVPSKPGSSSTNPASTKPNSVPAQCVSDEPERCSTPYTQDTDWASADWNSDNYDYDYDVEQQVRACDGCLDTALEGTHVVCAAKVGKKACGRCIRKNREYECRMV